MRIAAQYADEWNVWSTPELFRHKAKVLEQRCSEAGRDPQEIHRSTQAMLFLDRDAAELERFRTVEMPLPRMVGTPSEVAEIVAAYAGAGVDELIIPDFSLGVPSRRRETLDLFHQEIARHVS